MRRFLVWSIVCVLVVSLTAWGAGGWYYSDQLLSAPVAEDPEFTVAVLASDEHSGTVELEAPDGDLADLGHIGFRTPEGLLLLGGEVEYGNGSVIRRGELLTGEWPTVGEHGAPAVDAFAGDPAETLGLPFDTVQVPSALGPLPAWRVVPMGKNRDSTWVVIVHGRGAHKAEGNRALAVATEVGLPALSISIRNDPEAASDPDGFGRYGDVEWEDVQAAIEHLEQVEGAERFVLVGFSQGASLALTFLRRSPDAAKVTGAVLVSPLISLDETLQLQAEQRGIPSPLISPLLSSTRWVSTWRAGIDFDRLEHLDGLDELPDVPMLVTHGDADATTPIEPTRRFAQALGEQVTYIEFEGAGHVREWNLDRERFEAALEGFLTDATH